MRRSAAIVGFAFLLIAIAWLLDGSSVVRAAEPDAAGPATCLFDTGANATMPLLAAAVRDRKGWTALPEDDLTHKFAGDAALANDRLVLAVRAGAAGAELYGLGASGPVCRAAILPALRAGEAKRSSLRILENNPGAVMVEVAFESGGSSAKLTFRITTGQAILELRPGEGMAKLRIEAPSRYVAVPDFFGDDRVFSAGSFAGPRLGLPAENFVLHFVGRGDGLLMCVWPSNRQRASALLVGEGAERTIQGSEIECLPGKNLWIAALEGDGIWHEQTIPTAKAGDETVLGWKPPFPAKWRASLAEPSGAAQSWYFRGADDAEDSAGTLAQSSPCCLENQRALVRSLPRPSTTAGPAPLPLVVYPLDRNRATPLTSFCPIDVLRATLGVGPCQYILQTEGLAADANPTPDSVMTFVEKQFAKKREKKSADEIGELLGQMVAHVAQAQERIGCYAALARDVRAMCQTASAEELRPVIDQLQRASSPPGSAEAANQARRLANEVQALIGKGSAADCRRLGQELRRLGAVQDRAMANSRMATRWLRQRASMLAEQNPAAAELTAKIQARIEETLKNK